MLAGQSSEERYCKQQLHHVQMLSLDTREIRVAPSNLQLLTFAFSRFRLNTCICLLDDNHKQVLYSIEFGMNYD